MRVVTRGPVDTTVDLGDEDGLRAAYAAHGAELYRFARRQIGDDGVAQDVVQEVFLRAWRASDRFDPALGSLRVWLFTIARRVVVDEVRRASVRPSVPVGPDRMAVIGPSVGAADERTVTGMVMEEALRRLSAEHRDAIVETYVRSRPYAEVAAERRIPVGTLRSRVFYGMRALRLVLDEMGVEL